MLPLKQNVATVPWPLKSVTGSIVYARPCTVLVWHNDGSTCTLQCTLSVTTHTFVWFPQYLFWQNSCFCSGTQNRSQQALQALFKHYWQNEVYQVHGHSLLGKVFEMTHTQCKCAVSHALWLQFGAHSSVRAN